VQRGERVQPDCQSETGDGSGVTNGERCPETNAARTAIRVRRAPASRGYQMGSPGPSAVAPGPAMRSFGACDVQPGLLF